MVKEYGAKDGVRLQNGKREVNTVDYTGYGIAEGVAGGLGKLANTLQNIQQVGYELKRQSKKDKHDEKIFNLTKRKMELDPNIDPEHIRNITEIAKANASLKKEELKKKEMEVEDYGRETKRGIAELEYKAVKQADLREEYDEKRISGDWGLDEWTEKDGYLSVKRVSPKTETKPVYRVGPEGTLIRLEDIPKDAELIKTTTANKKMLKSGHDIILADPTTGEAKVVYKGKIDEKVEIEPYTNLIRIINREDETVTTVDNEGKRTTMYYGEGEPSGGRAEKWLKENNEPITEANIQAVNKKFGWNK